MSCDVNQGQALRDNKYLSSAFIFSILSERFRAIDRRWTMIPSYCCTKFISIDLNFGYWEFKQQA